MELRHELQQQLTVQWCGCWAAQEGCNLYFVSLCSTMMWKTVLRAIPTLARDFPETVFDSVVLGRMRPANKLGLVSSVKWNRTGSGTVLKMRVLAVLRYM